MKTKYARRARRYQTLSNFQRFCKRGVLARTKYAGSLGSGGEGLPPKVFPPNTQVPPLMPEPPKTVPNQPEATFDLATSYTGPSKPIPSPATSAPSSLSVDSLPATGRKHISTGPAYVRTGATPAGFKAPEPSAQFGDYAFSKPPQPFAPSPGQSTLPPVTRRARTFIDTARRVANLATSAVPGAVYSLGEGASAALKYPARWFGGDYAEAAMEGMQDYFRRGRRAAWQDIKDVFAMGDYSSPDEVMRAGLNNDALQKFHNEAEQSLRDSGFDGAADYFSVTSKVAPYAVPGAPVAADIALAVGDQASRIAAERGDADSLTQAAEEIFVQLADVPEDSPLFKSQLEKGIDLAIQGFGQKYGFPNLTKDNLRQVKNQFLAEAREASLKFRTGKMPAEEFARYVQPAVELHFLDYARRTGQNPFDFIRKAAVDGFDDSDLSEVLAQTGNLSVEPPPPPPDGSDAAFVPSPREPLDLRGVTGDEPPAPPEERAVVNATPVSTDMGSSAPVEEQPSTVSGLINVWNQMSGPERALMMIGIPLSIIGAIRLLSDDPTVGLLLLAGGLTMGGLGGGKLLSYLFGGQPEGAAGQMGGAGPSGQPSGTPGAPPGTQVVAGANASQQASAPMTQAVSDKISKVIEDTMSGKLTPQQALKLVPENQLAQYVLKLDRQSAVNLMRRFAASSQEYAQKLRQLADISLTNKWVSADFYDVAERLGISPEEARELIIRAQAAIQPTSTAAPTTG